jgi:hypothetical protein
LREFAAALGVTATIDELGIRAALIQATEEAASDPSAQPGRVTRAAAGRLHESLAGPGR